MNLFIGDIALKNKNNSKEVTIEAKAEKHKFYNLLFAGKITMQEYLRAIRTLEGNNRAN